MGETDVHREQIVDLIHALQVYFADNDRAYVSGDLLMFYEEGNPYKHRSPDVLVTLGIPKKLRDNYKIWEEGKAPDFIIEVTSKTTRVEDLGEKKGLYAVLGVQEYLIFDPLRDYLVPNFRAWRLEGGDYVPVVGERFNSEALGLEFRIMTDRLRVFRPDGTMLATAFEAEQRTQQLEAEVAALRRRLEEGR
ncbi:MAG TPA: Uma2 family endonuclease [Candidatus Xenobia bacterium]